MISDRGGPSSRGSFNNDNNYRRNDSYDGQQRGGRNNFNGEQRRHSRGKHNSYFQILTQNVAEATVAVTATLVAMTVTIVRRAAGRAAVVADSLVNRIAKATAVVAVMIDTITSGIEALRIEVEAAAMSRNDEQAKVCLSYRLKVSVLP